VARRPGLKVQITSATIETRRFAEYFEGAPVVEIEGRSYPVEVRYRPIDPEDESPSPLASAVATAAGELALDARGIVGDTLVFLPGERQIEEALELLRRDAPTSRELLPRYSASPGDGAGADLRAAPIRPDHPRDQCRRDLAHDPGRAFRDRLGAGANQPLQSARQAPAAADRADLAGERRPAQGTVGREGEESASGSIRRPTSPPGRSTRAEIHRTNLASLILQMAALGLGAPEEFRFSTRRTGAC
jgi:ATP-dependent helicase HrpA